MGFLLDTNVVSEARRARPDTGVRQWLDATPSAEMYLSVLAIGEIRRGVELLRRREQRRAQEIDSWLGELVAEYADRLLPVSAAVAEAWGSLSARRALPPIDGLMLATAHVHGLTFATREARAFDDLGVPTLSPWKDATGTT